MHFFKTFLIVCCLMLAACTGGSETATLDPDKADSREIAAVTGETRLALGAPSAQVVSLLGPADSTAAMDNGRQMWRYTGKRAKYIYVSNADNVQTLIIGEYSRDGSGAGLPLLLTVILDPAGKVADFNFSQLNF